MQTDVRVEIATPKGLFTGSFTKTTKVEEVIHTVVKSMQLDGGDAFELVYGDRVLKPVERPLVSFGIDGPGPYKLELVATGSGV